MLSTVLKDCHFQNNIFIKGKFVYQHEQRAYLLFNYLRKMHYKKKIAKELYELPKGCLQFLFDH
jgi:hypothetical protein